jgi:hypothetical protein
MALTSPPIFNAGAVTQTGTIGTAVTLNERAGIITTVNADLLANTNSVFTLNNDTITANSMVLVSIVSVGTTAPGTGNVTAQGQNQQLGRIDIVLSNSDGSDTGNQTFQVAFIVIGQVATNSLLSRPPVYTYNQATQATNITTAVTLNAQCGKITTQATGAVAADNNATFTLNNSEITADSVIFMSLASGGGGTGIAPRPVTVLGGKTLANGSVGVIYANGGGGGAFATPDAPVEIDFLVLDPTGGSLQSPPIFSTGTVTQATSLGTPVTLNTQAGVITTVPANVAANGATDFIFNNTQIYANSIVFAFVGDYAGTWSTDGIPQVAVTGIANGSCTIRVMNLHGANALNNNTLDISFFIL